MEHHSAALAWTFAGLAVAALPSRTLSSVLFERLSQHALAELRRTISSRVLATDLRRLERLGGPKIQSVISEHSANVAQFFVSLWKKSIGQGRHLEINKQFSTLH